MKTCSGALSLVVLLFLAGTGVPAQEEDDYRVGWNTLASALILAGECAELRDAYESAKDPVQRARLRLQAEAKRARAYDLMRQAAGRFLSASKLYPRRGEPKEGLGTVYYFSDMGDPIPLLEEAIRLGVKGDEVHRTLGLAYLKKGQPERALPPLVRAVKTAKEQAVFPAVRACAEACALLEAKGEQKAVDSALKGMAKDVYQLIRMYVDDYRESPPRPMPGLWPPLVPSLSLGRTGKEGDKEEPLRGAAVVQKGEFAVSMSIRWHAPLKAPERMTARWYAPGGAAVKTHEFEMPAGAQSWREEMRLSELPNPPALGDYQARVFGADGQGAMAVASFRLYEPSPDKPYIDRSGLDGPAIRFRVEGGGLWVDWVNPRLDEGDSLRRVQPGDCITKFCGQETRGRTADQWMSLARDSKDKHGWIFFWIRRGGASELEGVECSKIEIEGAATR